MTDDLTVNIADLDAKVLRLRPGDVVALISRQPLTFERAAAIREQWTARFPDLPVVVLESLDIAVMRREHEGWICLFDRVQNEVVPDTCREVQR